MCFLCEFSLHNTLYPVTKTSPLTSNSLGHWADQNPDGAYKTCVVVALVMKVIISSSLGNVDLILVPQLSDVRAVTLNIFLLLHFCLEGD